MALTWNLMCHSDSTKHIKVNNLIWREDALGIVFAHMKNDQEGTCKRVSRHLYANSFNLHISLLGALVQYFCMFPAVLMDPSGLLSPCLDQGDRFLKGFKTLLVDNEEEICRMGYALEDLGTHSICKGATTYANSSTTASPWGISISIRGMDYK
eukprot:8007076-Ditylum_brightwellii.AAC.1